MIYVIHIAFLKDEKHIEHFLYLTIYSISIDYEISIGFRNLRSEKAQGASLFTPNLRTEHKGSSPSFCFLTIYDHPYTIKYTKYFIVKGGRIVRRHTVRGPVDRRPEKRFSSVGSTYHFVEMMLAIFRYCLCRELNSKLQR